MTAWQAIREVLQDVPLIEGEEVENVIQATEGPVLLIFGAAWSAPCRRQAVLAVDVFQKMNGRVKIFTVDIEGSRHLAEHFEIHSIPTLIAFHHKVERQRFIGLQPAEVLVAALSRFTTRRDKSHRPPRSSPVTD